MRFVLNTLSPLHIGSGNKLEPFDFYIHNQRIIILNHDVCLETLYQDDPAGVSQFAQWVDETTRKINNVKQDANRTKDRTLKRDKNQLLQNLRRTFNIIDFTEQVLHKKDLSLRFLEDKKFHHYSVYLSSRPKGNLQLAEIIKTNGQPFIPGSSIKGMLRTALAYKTIVSLDEQEAKKMLQAQDRDGQGLEVILQKLRQASQEALASLKSGNPKRQNDAFKNLTNLHKRFDKIAAKHIEKYLFGCDDGEGKIGDPKFDIMRLIKVSDTQEAQAEMLAAEMKSITREGRTGRIKAQTISLAEFIDSESAFQFSLEVDTGLIKTLFARKNSRTWQGYEEKIERLFGLNKEIVAKMNDAELEEKIVQLILEALDQFGKSIVQKEKDWLQQFEPRDRSEIERLVESLSQRRNIAKLGFASGWFATTVGLAFSQNPELRETLPNILFAFNLDLIIKDEKLLKFPARDKRGIERQERLLQRTPNAQTFPKSRRLVTNGYIPSEYIGWVEIKKGTLKQKASKETVQEEEKQNFENMDSALAALKKHFNG